MHAAPRGPGLVLAGSLAAAVLFAALSAIFVIAPGIPTRLHAAFLHDDVGGAPIAPSGEARQAILLDVLERSEASAQRDRAFLDSMYAQQARPVRVKAIEGERILAIRQFELSNGERVAVLTNLGPAGAERSVQGAAAAVRTF